MDEMTRRELIRKMIEDDFEGKGTHEEGFCHGNRLSLRVVDEDFWFIFPEVGYYGPRDGLRKLPLRVSNPDGHRRYKPGAPRTHDEENFAEPPPWPHFKFCEKCGFVFEGGFHCHDITDNPRLSKWFQENEKEST